MRDTRYATEQATAKINDCRIERILVKAENQIEIRFSWWPDGKMANRPLDLPEPSLLNLIEEAIREKVFSGAFLEGLTRVLATHARYPDAG